MSSVQFRSRLKHSHLIPTSWLVFLWGVQHYICLDQFTVVLSDRLWALEASRISELVASV